MPNIQHSTFNIQYSARKRGVLLLELLIAISILAVVLSVGSQAVFVSLQSGKTSAESDVAMGLANEALEAVRGTAEEKWQNIYTLTKWTQHYYPAQSAGKWILTAGDEAIALNTANYTRYITIQNICRDTTPSSRAITGLTDGFTDTDGTLTTCTTSSGIFDPSTQKVTVTVSWQGSGSPVTISDYFIRWRNKVCNQTEWVGGKTYPSDPAPVSTNCSQSLTTYYNDDGNIDNTVPGSLKLK